MNTPRGSNGPILDTDYGQRLDKVMTFAGATANDPGDYDGTGNPATLFKVTGTVRMRILAVCNTTLVGSSATLEVGTTVTTAGLIAQTTAEAIDVNEIWHDAAPDASVELTSVLANNIVSSDVIQTVATANITAGKITYTCIWFPLSENGQVTV